MDPSPPAYIRGFYCHICGFFNNLALTEVCVNVDVVACDTPFAGDVAAVVLMRVETANTEANQQTTQQ
jgi:hypothetical protein